MKKIDKIFKHLIDKQFEFAELQLTYDDVIDSETWYQDNTITFQQSEQFRIYAVDYIRKNLKSSKKSAEIEISWFCLAYGLKLSDPENL